MLYNYNIFYSKKFNLPVIAVGNLSVGGTGKSPFVIYLSNLLKDKRKVAILSRGYGRKTKGFRCVNYQSTYEDVGDEPLQVFHRYRNRVIVAVQEKRVKGIHNLLKEYEINTVLLDDAFQHRAIKAGLYILLTDYSNLYIKDIVLPAGTLREGTYAAKRAQIIVVTKCPENLSKIGKQEIAKALKIKKHQQLYFSTIEYGEIIYSKNYQLKLEEIKDYDILLLTGIANPTSLINFAQGHFKSFKHLTYPDHYDYKGTDIAQIIDKFNEIPEKQKKIILTTEKDYMRLKDFPSLEYDLYYLPINMEIDEPEKFENRIMEYIDKEESFNKK